MRRWGVLVAVAALTFGVAACGSDDDDDAAVESDGGDDTGDEGESGLPDLAGEEVTVAVENAYLPFNYIDPETGEGAGWDYDAWNAICEKLNCVPKYEEAAWDGMIQAVSDGQFDAAADGITITDERAEVVDFSDGYITVNQRLLVRIGEDRFASTDDIAADDTIKIGTQSGTTNFETAVELFGEDRVQAFDQFPFAVEALINEDVDVVIMDETAGQGYVGANADKLELVGEPIQSDELGFIFPKDSDLVDPVNQALAALEADGTLEALAEKYFSEQFEVTYEDLES